MTREEKKGTAAPAADAAAAEDHAPSEGQVAAYLRDHPDFLLRHSDLLLALTPPAKRHGDGVADFQAFMIEDLRRRLEGLHDEHDDLLATSRENLSGQTRIHEAALALLHAHSFEQLVHTVTTDMAVILDLDVVTLCVEVAETSFPRAVGGGVYTLHKGAVDSILGSGRNIVLTESEPGDPAVFGAGAGLVQSAALMRLKFRRKGPVGLLALGSREPGHFHPGQGTELLGFVARVLEHCVRAWLDLPA